MTVLMKTKVIITKNLNIFTDYKTSTYQESLKNQVASFEDNEENKQGDPNPANNPDKVMEQFDAQDDQKIGTLAGRGGLP